MRKVFNGKDKAERIDGSGGDDKIFGNGGNDVLIGHNGDDKIKGGDDNDKIWGGRGEDTLWGNSGKDQFRFNSLDSDAADIIKDFQAGKDRVGLDIREFTALNGGLSEDNFIFGSAALDEDDHVLYDVETHQLFYDADGNGEGEKVLLATFTNNPEFTFEAVSLFGVTDT